MKLIIEKRTITEFAEIEKQISDNDQTFDQMHETWQILDDFFVRNPYEIDFNWRVTYFKTYVKLTWKLIGTIADDDKFISTISRQVPMAILLDVDVLKEIMWYLGFNKADKNKLISLYIKIKSAFLESEEIIGNWEGRSVGVKDLVAEYLLLEKREASSIEEAEFISKLKQVMFPKEVLPYIYTDPDVGINRFLELVEFFRDIDEERIWFVVDIFLTPEKYQDDFNKEKISVGVEEQPETEEVVTDDSEVKTYLTSDQIKSQIEPGFKKDAEGDFEDIAGVMTKLSELAEEFNDPSIAEMIYFDEEQNKFVWKE